MEVANNSIQNMDGAMGHRFVSAKRLNNGGILLEMNSELAAGWLNGPSVKTGFLEWLAPDAIIKG